MDIKQNGSGRMTSTKHKATLSPGEFRAIRKQLGLSQAALAAELGSALRTIQHWEMGTRPIPLMAEKLLRYVVGDDAIKKSTEKTHCP
jgi:DNA-binding transcriptional regulator YiaG